MMLTLIGTSDSTMMNQLGLDSRNLTDPLSSPFLYLTFLEYDTYDFILVVLSLSSPTLPSVSVSVSNCWRTARRLLPSSPTTVVLTILRSTMKSWLPVSVVRDMPLVIFPVSSSRPSRFPMSPSWPCGRERRRSPVLKSKITSYILIQSEPFYLFSLVIIGLCHGHSDGLLK